MTNLEVAQAARLLPIEQVAQSAHLAPNEFESLGRHKAKITFEGLERLLAQPRSGKLILVTAVTPTLAGEGKTTCTVGLTQALRRLGKSAVSGTREPALGPIFGAKGGACGGGYSQVLPMEEINLFFNGDFPAIAAAHNLLSAMLDAHIHHGNALGIDPSVSWWPRTVDMNDRALRTTVTGLGGRPNGPTRENSVVITPASEVMAIFCLSTSLSDLRQRLGNIVVGVGLDRKPRFARELKAHGAMTALLRDALRPNLVQNIEGGAALVHGGPFANIAHGCSSLISTQCGMRLADYFVTEAGFASDLGAEKFLDIVCPALGFGPDAIVLVATVKALELHGNGSMDAGFENLVRHVRHLQAYGVPVVVAINRFSTDLQSSLERLQELVARLGIRAVVADPYTGGGSGCEELARSVQELAEQPSTWRPLYEAQEPLTTKLEKICAIAYGGKGVELSPTAETGLKWLEKHGFDRLPVCVAKTQYSLSHDAKLGHSPTGFALQVREFRLSAGAGFVVAICGDMMLMPGLGKEPTATLIDVDDSGRITGLF